MELAEERLQRPRREGAGKLLEELLAQEDELNESLMTKNKERLKRNKKSGGEDNNKGQEEGDTKQLSALLDSDDEKLLAALEQESDSDSDYTVSSDEEAVDSIDSDFSDEEVEGYLREDEVEGEYRTARQGNGKGNEKEGGMRERRKGLNRAETIVRKVEKLKRERQQKRLERLNNRKRKEGEEGGSENSDDEEEEEDDVDLIKSVVRQRPPPTIPLSQRLQEARERAVERKKSFNEKDAAAALRDMALPGQEGRGKRRRRRQKEVSLSSSLFPSFGLDGGHGHGHPREDDDWYYFYNLYFHQSFFSTEWQRAARSAMLVQQQHRRNHRLWWYSLCQPETEENGVLQPIRKQAWWSKSRERDSTPKRGRKKINKDKERSNACCFAPGLPLVFTQGPLDTRSPPRSWSPPLKQIKKESNEEAVEVKVSPKKTEEVRVKRKYTKRKKE